MNTLTDSEARDELRHLCEEAGGIGAFAKIVGVDISAVSHQLNGHRPIQGKVAEHMGLESQRETTITYKRK